MVLDELSFSVRVTGAHESAWDLLVNAGLAARGVPLVTVSLA